MSIGQDKDKLAGLMPSSESRAQAYALVLVGIILLVIIIEAGLNYFVNPYGLYNSPFLIPRRKETRFIKTELLAKTNPKPQMLIVGSSHIRSIDPAYASKLFKLPAFNAGINGAQPKAWLSMTRYAVEGLGHPISIVLVGVDYGSFTSFANYMHDPIAVKELRPYLRHPFLSRLDTMKYILSPYQLDDSHKLLERWLKHMFENRSESQEVNDEYRSDGFRLDPPKSNPRGFKHGLDGARNLYQFSADIDQESVADFKKMIEFANSRGITIIFFLTPERPELEEKLSHTSYPKVKKQTEAILKSVTAPGIIFCDIDNSKIDFSDYIDWTHSGLETGRRLLDFNYQCYQKAVGG